MNKTTVLLLLFPLISFAQQRMLPLGTAFKDAAFAPSSGRLNAPAFFPVTDQEARVYNVLRDSVKRYSSFGYFLYQRELIEIRDSAASLFITPLFDLQLGMERNDSTSRKYQNTRGARVEGTFGKRFFFTTSFYENQAILPQYVTEYVQQRGEQYPQMTDSSYQTRNAVIPGGARTKPFKTNGFDYAWATGMITFFATPKWTIHWGNQQVFVGSGHRSLLWSDNSTGMMNLRMRYRFSDKWELQMVRARGLNLLRRPQATNGEAYYEPKSMSLAMVYFRPAPKVTIGLFEGGMWNRGDSVSQRALSPLYFVPLPFAATIREAQDQTAAFALTGLDMQWIAGKHVIYGQFGLNPAKNNSFVYQLGARLYPFSNPAWQIQIEYNHADNHAYEGSVSRLNYSHYNLPVAHPAGNHFDEVLLRLCWESGHWFILSHSTFFLSQPINRSVLMPVVKSTNGDVQKVLNQLLEVGYRFNRTYGLEVFGTLRYRNADGYAANQQVIATVGIRTFLVNHYVDF